MPSVLLCAALGAGAAYGLSKLQTEQYTATAALVFAGLPAAISDQAEVQPAARVKLVRGGDVAAKTARKFGR